jgi:predicted dehydrogenase
MKTFAMREYKRPLPEFVDRFGPAYKSELAVFVECCRTGEPFPTTHRDGLHAQEPISASMHAMFGSSDAAEIR